MHLVRNSRVFNRFELTLPKELRLECSALDHNRIDIRRLGHRCMFERRPMSASSGRLGRAEIGVYKSFNRKTRDSGIDCELSDLTRAAGSKCPHSHPKLAKIQTRQPTATPRQASCKTRAVTRRKRQKTFVCQNATKASATRSADTYKRVAQCATRVPTRPARLRASRPLSCDADLCRRRRRQNSIPQKCTASL